MTEEIVITDQEVEVLVLEPEVVIVHEGPPGAAGADGTGPVNAHIADTDDAHNASAISVVPAGGIASTNVQSALEEIDSEKSSTSHNHDGDYVDTDGDTMTGDLLLNNARLGVSALTFGTVEKFRVNTPTTVSNTANTMLAADAATSHALVVQGAPAATAAAVSVQNSAGTYSTDIWPDWLEFPNQANGYYTGMCGGYLWMASNTNIVMFETSAITYVKPYFDLTRDGRMRWGDGALTPDTNLYRSAADTLKTDDSFLAARVAVNGSSFGTVEKLRVNTPTTVSNTANAMIAASATTSIPIVAQAAASQTASLLELQTSTGSRLLGINPLGTNLQILSDSTVDFVFYPRGAVALYIGSAYTKFYGYLEAHSTSTTHIGRLAQQFGNAYLTTAMVSSTTALGTVEKFRVNTPTTVSNTANTMLAASAAADIPLVVQGASAQSANLQQWQDSTGAFGTYIKANGRFSGYSDLPMTWFNSSGTSDYANWNTTGSSLWLILKGVGGSLLVTPQGATGIPIKAQGYAAQSANLQDWQDSTGYVMANITAAGVLNLRRPAATTGNIFTVTDTTSGVDCVQLGTATAYGWAQGYLTISASGATGGTGGVLNVRTSGDGVFGVDASTKIVTFNSIVSTRIEPSATTSIGLMIRGKASQSGDLLRFSNSAAATLAAFTYDGALAVGAIPATQGAVRLISNAGIFSRNAANTTDLRMMQFTAGDELWVGGGGSIGLRLLGGTDPVTVSSDDSAVNFRVLASASAPSANLQEWQSSAGVATSWISSTGALILDQSSGITALQLKRGGTNIGTISAANNYFTLTAANMVLSGAVRPSGDASIGLIVKAYSATQTANLQEWQSDAGAVLAKINSSGGLVLDMGGSSPGTKLTSKGSASALNSNYVNATFGAYHTAHYQQINLQADYGTYINMLDYAGNAPGMGGIFFSNGYSNVVAQLTHTGTLKLNSSGTPGTVEKFRVNTPTTVDNSANAIIGTSAATSVGLVVQGDPAQSDSLIEAQNSSGTVRFSMSGSGKLFAGGTAITHNLVDALTIGASGGVFSTGGTLRLENNSSIAWRNAANSANIGLAVNASDVLTTGAAALILGNGGIPATSGALRLNNNVSAVWRNAANTGDTGYITYNSSDILQLDSGTAVSFRQSGNTISTVSLSAFEITGAPVRINTGTSFGTNEKLRVSAPSTVDNNANVMIAATATTVVPLVVQGYPSQTDNLQEWQSSAGTALAKVTSGGVLYGSSLQVFDSGGSYNNYYGTSYMLWRAEGAGPSSLLLSGATNNKPLAIRAYAGQTANLTEWQNSASAVIASMSANGTVTATALNTAAQSHGVTGATETIDLANGDVHGITLDANCTLTFSGSTSGKACTISIIVTQDGTGGWGITWPTSVDWPNATAPTLTGTAGSVDMFTFMTIDGGTTWYGVTSGLAFG